MKTIKKLLLINISFLLSIQLFFSLETSANSSLEILAHPKVGISPLKVNFSIKKYEEAKGEIVSYLWKFGDGVSSTSPNPVHIYKAPGKYVVSLTIEDTENNIVTSQTEINVLSGEEKDYEFLIKFQQHQLNYAYQNYFRIYDLYRSSPYIQEVDIATTGFALAGLCIAVEHNLINYYEAQDKALATINRILQLQNDNLTSKFGFFYHFYIWDDTKEKFYPKPGVEVSTIDSSLLLAGIITAGEYFGGEVKNKAERIYSNMDWRAFYDKKLGQFYMAYRNNNFFGHWDYYTDEILLIAILAIGSPNKDYRVAPEEAMMGWQVNIASYIPGEEYVYSWYGALFTYIYAHMFIDFKKLGRDKFYNIDWWENSIYAIKADIAWAKDNGYPENVWGITACWSKESLENNYMEYRWRIGAGLCGASDRFENKKNGIWAVGAHAAVSTIPFFEGQLKDNPGFKALKFMFPNMKDRSGLLIQSLDANNLDDTGRPKIASNWMVGMDILTPPVMIENYLSGLVWNTFMQNKNIKFALDSVF